MTNKGSLEELKDAEQIRHYRKNYYLENKERISKYQKEYYLKKKGLPPTHNLKWRGVPIKTMTKEYGNFTISFK